ncbi:MAG TPA: MmgE/PrpD family protein [Burkholderiales bacterium]|nr:MmgE/PrpD family protein [Burkholderiales bacterium]
MPTVAENLGAYASTLKYEDLPQEVVHQAKRFILDTLGCAFGGYDSEPARIARDLAATVSSTHPATLLCSGQKTSAELAVFANDVMIRYLDFNDGYISSGSGHPSDSIAALLSAAEVAGAGGRDLIVATVLAYEVFCRICDAWDNKKCGIDHATMGAIASVAGAARLYGLTEQQTVEAINLTVAANVALNQTRVGSISKWKACGYANANRNAVFAVELAARGMNGPARVFEGRDGFFNVVSRAPFQLAPFGGSGHPFRIMQCHVKQFPLGNFSQTVVNAALEARAFAGDPGNIREVHIHTSQSGLNIMADGPEKWRPGNRETADHSIPYTAAVALMYGTVQLRYFDEQYLHDEALLQLASRIKCSPSEEANRRGAEMNLCELDVTLVSGARKSIRVEYHRGHWRNPMSDAEMEAKFRSLVAPLLPASRVDALLGQLWRLEDLREVGTLIRDTKV